MNNTILNLSDSDLISLRADIENEIKKRTLPFTVGDIGEWHVLNHFKNTPGLSNLTLTAPGTKSIDATSRKGERYSIKTRKSATKTSTIYLDKKNPKKQLFDYILLVKIDDNYDLESIHQLTWKQFMNLQSWDITMSAAYVSCSKKVLKNAKRIV